MRYRKPSNFSRMERGATGAPTLPRELVVLVAHRVFVFTILLLLLLLLYTYTYIIRVYSTLLYAAHRNYPLVLLLRGGRAHPNRRSVVPGYGRAGACVR